MSLDGVKALTFDTGGTILDWHTGFKTALSRAGARHGLERDWTTITNDLRRRALGKMINLGEHEAPAYNFDGSHRSTLDELCAENGLDAFTEEDRHGIAWTAAHNFQAWPDFPDVLPRLKAQFMVCSFTILSFRIIMDTAKRNGLSWDAVFSCEAIGKYKVLPESYQTVAKWLVLDPSEICMVACHNFDLDAARKVGFKTAFVRRADEWGPPGPPDPSANPDCDIIVDSFPELAAALGVS
jgi:2-haloacid dehalogenase